eukprot:GFYU01004061.1.p1 GENE.GFYU01004061.1~~GFYU01004061.1.p1  ORF type:complete len:664 (+),score=145.53 GFYU01004061.1:74-2065(+)
MELVRNTLFLLVCTFGSLWGVAWLMSAFEPYHEVPMWYSAHLCPGTPMNPNDGTGGNDDADNTEGTGGSAGEDESMLGYMWSFVSESTSTSGNVPSKYFGALPFFSNGRHIDAPCPSEPTGADPQRFLLKPKHFNADTAYYPVVFRTSTVGVEMSFSVVDDLGSVVWTGSMSMPAYGDQTTGTNNPMDDGPVFMEDPSDNIDEAHFASEADHAAATKEFEVDVPPGARRLLKGGSGKSVSWVTYRSRHGYRSRYSSQFRTARTRYGITGRAAVEGETVTIKSDFAKGLPGTVSAGTFDWSPGATCSDPETGCEYTTRGSMARDALTEFGTFRLSYKQQLGTNRMFLVIKSLTVSTSQSTRHTPELFITFVVEDTLVDRYEYISSYFWIFLWLTVVAACALGVYQGFTHRDSIRDAMGRSYPKEGRLPPIPNEASMVRRNYRAQDYKSTAQVPLDARAEILDVHDNDLRSLEALDRWLSLRKLQLSHNDLTSITGLQWCSQTLLSLNLASNDLRTLSVPGPSFQLRGLRFLDVSSNDLSSLAELMFCPNLVWLNAANNDIVMLGDNFRHNMDKLQWVDLSNNDLVSLGTLPECPSLKYVNLYSNDLSLAECNHLSSLQQLRVVNVGHNKITKHQVSVFQDYLGEPRVLVNTAEIPYPMQHGHLD